MEACNDDKLLTGDVDVDEFMIGGMDSGKAGRTERSKPLVVLAVENVMTKKGKPSIGRAYAKTIDKADSKSLRSIFDEHIRKDSELTAEKWKGYAPLAKDWQTNRKAGEKGDAMRMLHVHLLNVKGWLRGIHHKCGADRLQHYLNEYHFRFNNRHAFVGTFTILIEKSCRKIPHPYGLARLCAAST